MSRMTWLFDLDNTLHDANPYIFPQINAAMRAYIEQHLGVDAHEATRLRQTYWTRYGATLLGLMRHHGIDPHHFLRETHQFPDLRRQLRFEPAVRRMLQRLPGRKILFSNAPRAYTEAILDLTGLRPYFAAVYAIENLNFQPKPLRGGFLALLSREKLAAERCILVEDSLANLLTAKRLGMQTVWVTRSLRRSPAVDVQIRHVLDLPARVALQPFRQAAASSAK